MPSGRGDMVAASPSSRDARAFAGGRGYLAACTVGLPRRRHAAPPCDATWSAGASAPRPRRRLHRRRRTHTRALRALVGVEPRPRRDRLAGLGLRRRSSRHRAPDGAEVLCVDGDFSSMVLPFLARGDLAGARTRRSTRSPTRSPPTRGSSRSRSCSPRRARWRMPRPSPRPLAAHGARTLCDATQASDGCRSTRSRSDAIDLPRLQVAVRPARRRVPRRSPTAPLAELTPLSAGWYAGDDPWTSCYGPDLHLAATRRRFDVSPAWQAFVGAEPALELFASLDADAVHRHALGLATAFRERLGLDAAPDSAIVTWPDAEGATSRASPRRASPHPAAPAARASPSTSGTTRRTSSLARPRSAADARMPRRGSARRTHGIRSVPSPVISTSMASPSTNGPTPAGVPGEDDVAGQQREDARTRTR